MKRLLEWQVRHKKILNIAGIVLFAFLMVAGLYSGIFTDTEKMSALLTKCGIWAPIVFIFIQALQVVVPILPGAVGCAFGVMFFGTLYGFFWNYIGICIGSVCAFLLARKYGTKFVHKITGKKFCDRYERFLQKENRFEKIFALLIFLPVAPDDFLCYLAGISKMTLKKFTVIILLGKPAAIILYSLGLNKVLQMAISLITRS